MAKTTLMVLGIVIALIGVWALIPSMAVEGFAEPVWFAIAQVVIGIIAVWIGSADKA